MKLIMMHGIISFLQVMPMYVEQAASNEVKHYFGSPRHKGGDGTLEI
jgi:hypothetical protein